MDRPGIEYRTLLEVYTKHTAAVFEEEGLNIDVDDVANLLFRICLAKYMGASRLGPHVVDMIKDGEMSFQECIFGTVWAAANLNVGVGPQMGYTTFNRRDFIRAAVVAYDWAVQFDKNMNRMNGTIPTYDN